MSNLAELFDSSMMDAVLFFFFFLLAFIFLFIFLLALARNYWCFLPSNDWFIVCISAILTGSSDHSILSTDVETGSVIARLEDAHEYVPSLLFSVCLSSCTFNQI